MAKNLTLMPALAGLSFLILCLPAAAQNGSQREGFRLGLELGAGSVERTRAGAGTDDTTFYMGFAGGYWFNRQLMAGLELNGWLLQASNLNDPAVGEGISRIFAFARLYPGEDQGWFAKVAAGYASHWNHRPGEPGGDSGDGFEVGGGYDLAISRSGSTILLTPFATYSRGTIGGEQHNAVTIGLGIHYQF